MPGGQEPVGMILKLVIEMLQIISQFDVNHG